MRPKTKSVEVSLLVSVVALAVCVPAARAGTIRHDVPDWKYLKMGERFENVGLITGGATYLGDEYTYYGSGVLIEDEWVLTASHMFNPAPGTVAHSLTIGLGGRTYVADQAILHPNWSWYDLLGGYDIGLFHLTEEVKCVKPAKLYDGPVELGRRVTIAGYGATGTGLTGAGPFDFENPQRRAGTNVVDGMIGYGDTVEDARLLVVDFDNPDDPNEGPFFPTRPTNREILPAPGDSGGGLFVRNKVAGIVSLGWAPLDGVSDSDYGDAAIFTRVSSHIPWIESIVDPDDDALYFDLDDDDGEVEDFGAPTLGLLNPDDFSNNVVLRPLFIPEPTTMGLLAIGAIALIRRRKR